MSFISFCGTVNKDCFAGKLVTFAENKPTEIGGMGINVYCIVIFHEK
jgi:hypothetical protein